MAGAGDGVPTDGISPASTGTERAKDIAIIIKNLFTIVLLRGCLLMQGFLHKTE
jgi:hypothetical protein